ncbi:chorismate mutase [Marinicauda algicola]|uniref:Bifunctional chorismate mutase/prephenate dehydratase n=1 Tax=Marinicauda algicola TaxID=2029849 RepID=A0A4S2GW92_9PROT|nr:prephenate dehydratase domain-containing protein [Marinicauda algicola]TGY87380.1 chorismate mutase [Marinicauda algicola]
MAHSMDEERAELRRAIDAADEKLVHLLSERRKLGEALGALKAGGGQRVRDTERERAVLERAVTLASAEGLDPAFVERVFQLVIDDSLRRQRAGLDARVSPDVLTEARVAYLGGPGSYSHFAALAHFDGRYSGIEPVIKRDFAGIFAAAESGEADYGFVPIENTTTGGIVEVYDLMRDTALKIAGEHHYKVEHCLVGKAAGIGSVQTVYGHPQALRQSQRFLSRHKDLKPVPVSSSTRALERAMDEGPEVAAIAGADAARLFGLNVIDANASDNPGNNYTRFVALAKDPAPASPLLPCKTSIVFVTSDAPGSLVTALEGFRREGVNLTRLESRPVAGEPWSQMFFLDIEGHEEEGPVARALASLREHAKSIRSFGSYGADRLPPASREA